MSPTSNDTISVCIGQLDVAPGRPRDNLASMRAMVQRAKEQRADLIIFPEMAIPGYLLGDEWERPAFLRECEACGEQLREDADGIIIVFGNVAMDWSKRNEDGRTRKYNALFVAEGRRFLPPRQSPYPFVIKTLLPNYRQFDDSRHFFDLRKLAYEEGRPVEELIQPVPTSKATLGCILCEDAWDMDYAISPLSLLAKDASVELFINASASPFTINKNHKRHRVFSQQVRRLERPLLYVNNVGIQNNGKTIYTFDGSSCIYDPAGNALSIAAPFEEACAVHEIPLRRGSGFLPASTPREDSFHETWTALQVGTRRFMEQVGVKRVTIGVSGGIDSAVVAAIYGHLLPPDALLLVNMPSRYNSPTTRGLARQLADNIGCYYTDIPIEDAVALTHSQIHDLTISTASGDRTQRLELSDFMMENIQARDRSSRILSAVSAAFGGVFTCNANKSEATVGYATLYGDLAGYLANIADLWKSQVYELARYLNEHVYGEELIPVGSIDIVPSAELSHNHNVDEGKGDPLVYPYHDRLFASWVERWDRLTPEEILTWYQDGTLADQIGYAGDLNAIFKDAPAFIADLERWWGLYQGMALAKRIQAPPILAVKRRAFGFDHRESQLGARYTQGYPALNAALLGPTQ
jgi:NAD+ synthase (glutamine-hydrolysing)